MDPRERFEQKHTAQRNFHAVLELQRAKEAKQTLTALNSDPSEDLAQFDSRFKAQIETITRAVEALTSSDDLIPRCEQLRGDVLRVLDYLNVSTHFLHPHTVTQCHTSISALQDDISSAQERLQPRKKFAFRGKITAKKTEEPIVVPQTESVEVAFEGVADVRNQTIVKSISELEQANCYQLKNLVECTVILPGKLKAVLILNVERCRIYVGSVSGAAHITNCTGSTVSISCHQLRIHHSSDSTFYVSARTQPIVEDVRGLLFAPYNFDYEGQEARTEDNAWNQVIDFKWLKSEPSPNWAVLPEDRRDRFHYSQSS